jgi:pyrroline-5-carboxylate reductase
MSAVERRTVTPARPSQHAGTEAQASVDSAAQGARRILLVGYGAMGRALVAGWTREALGDVLIMTRQAPGADLNPTATSVRAPEEIPDGFAPDVIVLAIKPQQAAAALRQCRRFAADDPLMLSIMAGQTVRFLASDLWPNARVVRAMPNMPAAIGKGFTCAFAAPGVTLAQRASTEALLCVLGDFSWIADEALMDCMTALSGGGPAYVFLLAELLEQVAIDQGLPPDIARLMARRVVAGSGALLEASARDAAHLRAEVTSAGGATESALQILMAPEAWPKLIRDAIAAATWRSRELGAARGDV